jgi:hypothetical protein
LRSGFMSCPATVPPLGPPPVKEKGAQFRFLPPYSPLVLLSKNIYIQYLASPTEEWSIKKAGTSAQGWRCVREDGRLGVPRTKTCQKETEPADEKEVWRALQ